MHTKSFHPRSFLLAVGSLVGAAATAGAQGLPVTLWTQNGPASHFNEFGAALDGLGDLNGDGLSDWIVGSPSATIGGLNQAGRVNIYYSNGAPAATINGANAFSNFGQAVSDAGDQTGDGVSEILVGSPQWPGNGTFRGKVSLYNGATLAPITNFFGLTNLTQWGLMMCSLGDLNSDGQGDYAFNGDYGGNLAVYVMSGANNQILYVPIQPGMAMNDIANAGDVNGDGKDDLIVGFATQTRVYNGATGALLFTIAGAPGISVAGPGDVNGDGVPDIAVGDNTVPGVGGGQYGQVSVYSGANQALLWSRLGDGVQDEFGLSITAIGDINNDGAGDLAAGAPERQSGFFGLGYVRVLSGPDGCDQGVWTGATLQSWFGAAVGDAGDVDGDGRRDLMIGDPHLDVSGFIDTGFATVKKGALSGPSVGTMFCHCGIGFGPCGNDNTFGAGGCLNSTGQPGLLQGFGSASVSADNLFLVASGLPSSTPTLFFSGTTKAGGGFGLPLLDGLVCVSGTIFRLNPAEQAVNGVAVKGPCEVVMTGGYLAGQTLHFQNQYRDLSGPCGFGANQTNGLTVTFTP